MEFSSDFINKWSDFVYSHPDGNIFQTPLMYNVYSHSKHHEPVLIISRNSCDDINGVLLAVIVKEGSRFTEWLTRRAIIYGGPLVKNNDPIILNYLISSYLEKVEKRAIYSQIRNMKNWENLAFNFLNCSFIYVDHLDIIHDLKQSESNIWNNFEHSKRKNINNATRKGIVIKRVNLNQDIHLVYNILLEVYKRAKLPIFNIDFLTLMHQYLQDHLICLGAYLNDKLIGVRLVLCYKKLIYDWYAGSLEDYLSFRPNDILPWEVMKWGKLSGFELFDFGGAGKPNIPYGVREYKMKFGGQLVNYGRFEKIHRPLLMKTGKLGFTIYKNLYGLRNKIKF